MSATKAQVAICLRFGSPVEVPLPFHKVGIALQTLGDCPLTALRHPPQSDTCGWYIWAGEFSDAPEFFQPLHVSHLQEYCPEIVPYLGLVPGWGVVIAPGYEDAWFDEEFLLI